MPCADVSVLMATYNRSVFIAESLRSLLDQTIPPAEIVVVDDGSSDSTAQIVAGIDPRVRYYYQENSGKPAAINFALQQAKSTWIWVFDDDDIALPGALEAQCNALAQYPNAGYSYSMHGDLHPVGDGWARRMPDTISLPDPADVMFALLTGAWIAYMPGMLVRRSVFLDLNGFREDMLRVEDEEFVLRLAGVSAGVPVAEVTFLARRHFGDRGPRILRFMGEGRTVIDRTYLQKAYREIYASWPLSRYCAPGSGNIEGGRCGVDALVVRMAVMMRVGLWDRVFDDWTQIRQCDAKVGRAGFDTVSRVACGLDPICWTEFIGSSGAFDSDHNVSVRSVTANDLGLALQRGAYWRLRREFQRRNLLAACAFLWVFVKLWLFRLRLRGRV